MYTLLIAGGSLLSVCLVTSVWLYHPSVMGVDVIIS